MELLCKSYCLKSYHNKPEIHEQDLYLEQYFFVLHGVNKLESRVLSLLEKLTNLSSGSLSKLLAGWQTYISYFFTVPARWYIFPHRYVYIKSFIYLLLGTYFTKVQHGVMLKYLMMWVVNNSVIEIQSLWLRLRLFSHNMINL